jgi:tripartite-type tricarboxylate transporter receptor subunit TctC
MRRLWITLIAAVAIAGSASAPQAQDRPIRIIFPFAAGGSGDAMARLVADKMRASLNRSVIVENPTGAAGRIGVSMVKNAAPDGATLLLTPIAPVAVYPHTYKSLDYDPLVDLAPVSQIATFDFIISVGAKVPVSSLAELVAWCKANPAQANFGIPAIGTLPHFIGAMFARAAAIDLRPVPYRGAAAATADLIAGQIPIIVGGVSDLAETHRAGRVRILATAAANRSPFIPDVPTFRDSGYDIVATSWYAVLAPARTPANIIERLSTAIAAAVQSPDVKERLLTLGVQPTGTSAAALAKIQKDDSAFWGAAVKASGFVADQ